MHAIALNSNTSSPLLSSFHISNYPKKNIEKQKKPKKKRGKNTQNSQGNVEANTKGFLKGTPTKTNTNTNNLHLKFTLTKSSE